MKQILLLTIFAALFSCNPEDIVRKQQEDLIMQAIVNGQWKVTKYTTNGYDVTPVFDPYKFQFRSDFSVEALNAGQVEYTGTWAADPDAETITASFPNASHPLILLNGTFIIESTTWTSVDASQTVNGELRTLRMEKL